MRGFRPISYLVRRHAFGWSCHSEGEVLTELRFEPVHVDTNHYGRFRLFTLLRGILALRRKARKLRALEGMRKALGWPEHFN